MTDAWQDLAEPRRDWAAYDMEVATERESDAIARYKQRYHPSLLRETVSIVMALAGFWVVVIGLVDLVVRLQR